MRPNAGGATTTKTVVEADDFAREKVQKLGKQVQGGPLPVISGVITPISRLITPVTRL